MYFNKKIVKGFAEREQNPKHFAVADIVDQIIMQVLGEMHANFKACELGGWAHPDRYHRFFWELLKNGWTIDRVDISPYMLELAKKYLDTPEYRERLKVIKFVENDIAKYLTGERENSIDLAIMKYAIDHIQNIDQLFNLLQKKLKKWWILVATIWVLSPELRSISPNARFLYKGEAFPEDEIRILKDGDIYTVNFLKVFWKPEYGYLPWAKTTKWYHSEKRYRQIAKREWFDVFVGDWKKLISQKKDGIAQYVLVLKK